ncbi:beta-lactamase-like protein [Xylariales sp. PMI_506]|nr:beta-lactamase-like protein [Xylariales sp. PMI_506]
MSTKPSIFPSSLTITHVGTATAIIQIGDDVTLLTDPYLSPAGTSWEVMPGISLTSHYAPSHTLDTLPPVDAVLLSHEDHPDNLDTLGRRLLDGRRTVPLRIGGTTFFVTGTPCVHLPGGECVGFALTAPKEFGTSEVDGLPNALWFSGDTVYTEELGRGIRERFHVRVALVNAGAAAVAGLPGAGGPVQITMDGRQAAQLLCDVGADVLVPMHYEGWTHFTEGRAQLEEALRSQGVLDQVRFLELGVPSKII